MTEPAEHTAQPRTRLTDPAGLCLIGLGSMAVLNFFTIMFSGALDDYQPGLVHTLFAWLLIVGWLYTAVTFILWLHLARENLEDNGADGLRWKPVQPVVSWFTPVANLWVPMLVVAEVYYRSDKLGNEPLPRKVAGWWATFVISLILFAFHEFAVVNASVLFHYEPWLNLVYGAVGCVAAGLGFHIVSHVTEIHQQWATAEPDAG
ncbi:DUF4328 domain-containing protein [Dactylosporangium vinaceum]|uniref:DUF4328 domain-containing protein n=1 Tax=Dactylosporangium vinaceum TaxID=53362 RepID=A0ABV5M5Z9_9ACTN|nr:DUF4328 domain-containing protein [Dactylosporangium vinaceum]UAC01228.1 DUF4328 domain-containing protein [Dactylosporangium vinaceum]